MIEEQGSVISGDGDFVVVSVERQSACGSCSAKAGCGTSLLADWFPRRRLTLRLPNTVGAKPGEAVVLGLVEARFQTASLLLYALPLAGLLLGAIAGESLVGVVGGPPELGGVGGGLLGLIAALRFVKQRSRRTAGTAETEVQLLRVAHRPKLSVPIDGIDAVTGSKAG